MNSKPPLQRDDFDSVNELSISDDNDKGLNKVPSSNIKNKISNVNSNGICLNTKNPFINNTSLKKSKYSLQHMSSLDKTVRNDSFENPNKTDELH